MSVLLLSHDNCPHNNTNYTDHLQVHSSWWHVQVQLPSSSSSPCHPFPCCCFLACWNNNFQWNKLLRPLCGGPEYFARSLSYPAHGRSKKTYLQRTEHARYEFACARSILCTLHALITVLLLTSSLSFDKMTLGRVYSHRYTMHHLFIWNLKRLSSQSSTSGALWKCGTLKVRSWN